MGSPEAGIDPESRLEQDEIARQQKSMEQGMPAKNLKRVALLVAAGLAGGYMLYPVVFPKQKESVPVVQSQAPGDKPLAGSIVEQLKSQPLQKPLVEVVEPAPKPPVAAVSQDASNPDRPLTARELEMTRREAITASAMEPTEVALKPREGRDSAAKQDDDPGSMLAKALKDQNSILEKTLTASNQPGEQQAPFGASPNRRSTEDDFVLKSRSAKLEDPTRLAPARAKASLYEGTIIQVVLDRAINTDNPGTARGRVRSDVYDSVTQETLLIPRGSIVILPYLNSVLVGQARILVVGQRLIFPNGKSFSLSGTVAGDMQGASGIPADVDNHFYEMFKASFVVGAVSLLLPKNQQQISVSESPGGNRQTGGSILGATLYDTIQKISERNASIKPTASVEVGEPFTLMLSKDVEMEPYMGRK